MSRSRKLYKAFREVPHELHRFLTRRYPSFVTAAQAEPLRGQVPVFMYHTIDQFVFQEQLEFLKTNGYETLTLAQFMAFLKGEFLPRVPSVVLSFDDGDTSWYRVAYPLLKRYGFHAIVFVVPHFLRETPADISDRGWLSWPEVIEMDRSGVFDVQSHSLYHDNIFTGPKLVDFFHPDFEQTVLGLEVPWVNQNGRYTNRLGWGTPIYRFEPRMGGRLRYVDDQGVREACVSWVESRGGVTFFQSPRWRQELKTFYRTSVPKNQNGSYESAGEQRTQILEQLRNAKELLEDRLGKRVEHLCYPWGVGSALGVSLSREAGYISNFWVSLPGRNTNRPGESSFHIARLKDDYLFRLPGQGRRSLGEIFANKVRRRTEKVDIY